jgi:hypothetical protein
VRILLIMARVTFCFMPLLATESGTGQTIQTVKDPTAAQIVARMEDANALRAKDLQAFTGQRVYKFQYHGFPANKEAEMVVTTHYTSTGGKQFDVISESGSAMIVKRVLKRLLESERDASLPENLASVAVSADNYRFELLGRIQGSRGECYRMHAEPKRDSKYLFRGEIWVNAADFAVERVDAEAAKNPALWIIRKTHIQSTYQKIGEFWVPAFNKSESTVTLGGVATLTVQYTDYVFTPKQRASGR